MLLYSLKVAWVNKKHHSFVGLSAGPFAKLHPSAMLSLPGTWPHMAKVEFPQASETRIVADFRHQTLREGWSNRAVSWMLSSNFRYSNFSIVSATTSHHWSRSLPSKLRCSMMILDFLSCLLCTSPGFTQILGRNLAGHPKAKSRRGRLLGIIGQLFFKWAKMSHRWS